MNTKMKEIDLEDYVNNSQPTTQEQDFYGLCARVKNDNPYTQYPSWFDEIVVPEGTKMSPLSGFAAWNELTKMRKTMKELVHPVYKIDDILTYSDVKFNGPCILYEEENQSKQLNIYRGYYIDSNDSKDLAVAAATVADSISYYTRANPDNSTTVPSIPPEEGKKIAMMRYDCLDMRVRSGVYLKSETKSRDAIYAGMMKQPCSAYRFATDLIKQYPKYGNGAQAATKHYFKLLTELGKKIPKEPVTLRVAVDIKPPPFRDNKDYMDVLYNVLTRSRSIRGTDNGIGMLTFGYILGCMPRAVAKYITFFLDIRQLLVKFNVSVIMIVGKIPEMVVRMLVHNNYFVVNSSMGIKKNLTEENFEAGKFDVYSSISDHIPYGIYHEVASECPTYIKNVIGYKFIDVDANFQLVHCVPEMVKFKALRGHMTSEMEDPSYSLLPCSMPHNGMVICVVPKIFKITLEEMAYRCVYSNFWRNNHIGNPKLWCLIDDYAGDCGYLTPFVIPKMKKRSKASAIDYSKGFDFNEGVVEKTEMNVDHLAKFKKDPTPIDDSAMMTALFKEAKKNRRNWYDYAYNYVENWDEGKLTLAVAAYKLKMNCTAEAFHRVLVEMFESDEHVSDLEQGYQDFLSPPDPDPELNETTPDDSANEPQGDEPVEEKATSQKGDIDLGGFDFKDDEL